MVSQRGAGLILLVSLLSSRRKFVFLNVNADVCYDPSVCHTYIPLDLLCVYVCGRAPNIIIYITYYKSLIFSLDRNFLSNRGACLRTIFFSASNFAPWSRKSLFSDILFVCLLVKFKTVNLTTWYFSTERIVNRWSISCLVFFFFFSISWHETRTRPSSYGSEYSSVFFSNFFNSVLLPFLEASSPTKGAWFIFTGTARHVLPRNTWLCLHFTVACTRHARVYTSSMQRRTAYVISTSRHVLF